MTGDVTRSSEASKQPVPLDPGLYVVATPIGHARDITLRALDVLREADILACEDTRVTAKLLSIHGIQRDGLTAYHEHNAEKARPRLIEALNSGKIVAVVSDAGTPMINDPGFRLVQDCRAQDIPVHALPGASAVTTALVLAGLPTDRFLYLGFAPPKSGKRRTWLGNVRDIEATLVFLESPNRLAATLADMADVLGPRPATVLREMTKKFEEVRAGTLTDLADHYHRAATPKGEVTLVVGAPDDARGIDAAEVDRRLAEAMTRESVKSATSRIAAETGWARRDVYARALKLKEGEDPGP